MIAKHPKSGKWLQNLAINILQDHDTKTTDFNKEQILEINLVTEVNIEKILAL